MPSLHEDWGRFVRGQWVRGWPPLDQVGQYAVTSAAHSRAPLPYVIVSVRPDLTEELRRQNPKAEDVASRELALLAQAWGELWYWSEPLPSLPPVGADQERSEAAREFLLH